MLQFERNDFGVPVAERASRIALLLECLAQGCR